MEKIHNKLLLFYISHFSYYIYINKQLNNLNVNYLKNDIMIIRKTFTPLFP